MIDHELPEAMDTIAQIIQDANKKILNEILNSKYKDLCIPLVLPDPLLPIIKSCNVSICNDTSYSHLSAALGIQTITLMADTPLIYGAYTALVYAAPDGESTVTHDTLGKDKINSKKIFAKLIQILNIYMILEFLLLH